jgi:hypothetical protein
LRHNKPKNQDHRATALRMPTAWDYELMRGEVFDELAGKYEYAAKMTRREAEARAKVDADDYIRRRELCS